MSTQGTNSTAPLVLVVEDESDIREMVEYNLSREGYRVRSFESGHDLMRFLRTESGDLILLDVMLPGSDGFEICRRLKSGERTRHIPVIMVTAKADDTNVVTGLELGADDYVTKPFSPKVLLARVRRTLRRGDASDDGGSPSGILRVGALEIEPDQFRVSLQGRPIQLTQSEMRILIALAEKPGWVLSREQLIQAMHSHVVISERAIDVQIVGLRKKLGESGPHIETVRGVGYRLVA